MLSLFVLFSSLSLHHRCLHFTVSITSENSNLRPSSFLSKVVPDALPAPRLYPALARPFLQLLQDGPRPALPVASLPVWRLLMDPWRRGAGPLCSAGACGPSSGPSPTPAPRCPCAELSRRFAEARPESVTPFDTRVPWGKLLSPWGAAVSKTARFRCDVPLAALPPQVGDSISTVNVHLSTKSRVF